jgi:hypothetical protein
VKRNSWLILSATIIAFTGVGCSNPFFANFFAPLGEDTSLQGTVTVTFVNNTNYRVTTYWGVYNPLDLTRNVVARKLVLEAGQSGEPLTGFCTRQIDVAGPDLRFVVRESGISDVNYTQINDKIKFSTVIEGTEVETVGTADPGQFHIGVDFECGDTVEIHFKQDAQTKAFSVEMVVVTEED